MIEQKVREFWKFINNADFDKLVQVMSEDANVILPNTKEIFNGCNKYIKFNKDYPGRWYAKIEKLIITDSEAITAVKKTNDDGVSHYVTSFFEFENGLIKIITEYWGENGEAPEWRQDKDYLEVYQ
ncbi:nuclear transport factor 2 family protein [Clostridiaceae bacterium M8S5]|nr:nuclear transport factor 2 family protein [Clostridiaceae bacterium M8S5]